LLGLGSGSTLPALLDSSFALVYVGGMGTAAYSSIVKSQISLVFSSVIASSTTCSISFTLGLSISFAASTVANDYCLVKVSDCGAFGISGFEDASFNYGRLF
jgi:hypothetical protein